MYIQKCGCVLNIKKEYVACSLAPAKQPVVGVRYSHGSIRRVEYKLPTVSLKRRLNVHYGCFLLILEWFPFGVDAFFLIARCLL